jgi:hypothetical protein
MRSPLLWVITQRVVVIYYRRFGTTYRSHLQGSSKLPALYEIRIFVAGCTGICRESLKSIPRQLLAISFIFILRLSFRLFLEGHSSPFLSAFQNLVDSCFFGCVLHFSPISPSRLNEPIILGVKSTRYRASNGASAWTHCWYSTYGGT